MRLYRGLTKDGKWVHGFLISLNRIMVWDKDVCMRSESYQVIPETVGQSAGFKDKNGKEVYAGDIVVNAKIDRKDYSSGTLKDCVVVVEMGNDWPLILNESERLIIGNIHQHSELLENNEK